MQLKLDRVLRFIAIADEMSFSRAAEKLNVDQPWLSRQVIQLEEQLGFALFRRSGRQIELTEKGQTFLDHCRLFSKATDELRQRAEEISRQTRLSLPIGAAYLTYCFRTRNRLIERYRRLRTDVEVTLRTHETTGAVLPLVVNGEVDIGFVLGRSDLSTIEQARVELGHTTLSLPPEDALSKRPVLRLEQLSGRRVAVGPRWDAERHSALYGWIADVGAVPVEVPEGRRYMVDMAERERLVVVHLTDAEKEPDGFRRISIEGRQPRVDMFMVKRKGLVSTNAERFWRLGEGLSSKSVG